MIPQRLSSTYGMRRNSIGASLMHTILIILTALLIAAGLFFYWQSTHSFVDTRAYQAVFLDNDQVYFGKIVKETKRAIQIEDVYYLQVNSSSVLEGITDATEDSFALVKLGNELHGPEDAMYIYRDNILYIENLQSDSRVVMAINEYKNK